VCAHATVTVNRVEEISVISSVAFYCQPASKTCKRKKIIKQKIGVTRQPLDSESIIQYSSVTDKK